MNYENRRDWIWRIWWKIINDDEENYEDRKWLYLRKEDEENNKEENRKNLEKSGRKRIRLSDRRGGDCLYREWLENESNIDKYNGRKKYERILRIDGKSYDGLDGRKRRKKNNGKKRNEGKKEFKKERKGKNDGGNEKN